MKTNCTLIITVLAAVVGGAVASGPAASQDPPAGQTISLFSRDRDEHAVDLDLGRRGASLGDRTIARGRLVDPTDTRRRRGSFTAEIVTFDPKTLLSGFTATLVLPGGQVQVDGSLPFRRTLTAAGAVLPVTGGTGDYRSARGTMTVRARTIRGDEGFTIDLELL